MTATASSSVSRLHAVRPLGQRLWLDNLSRSLLEGPLQALVLDDGIAGVTSNPAIFHKAIASDPAYAADLAALRRQPLSAEARYEALAIADVQRACDLLSPMWRDSRGDDGLVSLEVSPAYAHDAAATVSEGRRLWQAIARPNAMIKVPATAAGLQAFSALIADGVNVNLTLLFSRAQLAGVFPAYRAGLAQRLAAGGDVGGIKAVASLFISRLDSLLDPQLAARAETTALQGEAALAMARLAYQDWLVDCQHADWAPLRAAGAQPLRLLWASTGVKNPAYSDVRYVEQLIGADTVNTVPDTTLAAFRDHGEARATLAADPAAAAAVYQALQAGGVDFAAAGEQLQADGLKQFEQAFAALLQLTA